MDNTEKEEQTLKRLANVSTVFIRLTALGAY